MVGVWASSRAFRRSEGSPEQPGSTVHSDKRGLVGLKKEEGQFLEKERQKFFLIKSCCYKNQLRNKDVLNTKFRVYVIKINF